MTFDKILDDKRLWAVRYEGEKINCFDLLFSRWYDMVWLRSFFQENLADLSSFFHITDVYEAVMETIDQARRLECVRNFLLNNGVYDLDGLNDYVENEQDN